MEQSGILIILVIACVMYYYKYTIALLIIIAGLSYALSSCLSTHQDSSPVVRQTTSYFNNAVNSYYERIKKQYELDKYLNRIPDSTTFGTYWKLLGN